MTPPPRRLRTAIYLRISLDLTGEGAGVDRQLAECVQLCDRLGFDYDVRHHSEGGSVYRDNDMSATSGKVRPDFEALLADRPDVIVVWHTDRLVRVTKDLERVIDLKVAVHAVTAGHLDLSTPAGRAVGRTVTAWATYEGEQKALRQKAANAQRAIQGKPRWTVRPFGYNRDGSLIEHEALAIRLAYADLLNGVSLGAIARRMNSDGQLTSQGKPWAQSSVSQLLVHPRNAGLSTYYDKEVGQAKWGVIIPEHIYRRARRLMDMPERKPGGAATGRKAGSLLAGIATCGKCGGRINKGVPGYVCAPKRCVTHIYDLTNQYVRDRVVLRLSEPGAVDFWTPPVDEVSVQQLTAERERLKGVLDEMAEDRAAGAITREQLQKGSAQVMKLLTVVDSKLARVGENSALEGLASAEDVGAWFDALTLERQRAVLMTVTADLRLAPRGRGLKTFDSSKVRLRFHGDAEDAA